MARVKKEKIETKVKKEKVVKAKAIGPYDIIKMMFTDIDAFDKLSNNMLERNAFMINRVFSIQYPQQAQCFNNIHINLSDIVKSWRLFAVKSLGYGKMPGFVYTKGAKQTTDTQKNTVKIDKNLKESYCLHHNINMKDFNDILYFYQNELLDDINKYEKIISPSEQLKAFQKG